jgi:outer membrane protein TolC
MLRTLLIGIALGGLGQVHAATGVLTLDEALGQAELTHPEIQLQLAELELARAEALQTDGDDDLDIRLALNPAYVIPPSIAPQDRNDSQAHLVAQKKLYDFGQTKSLIDAAELSTAAQEHLYRHANHRLRLAVMKRYFDVLLADIEFAVENEAMAMAYVRVDRARDEFDLGKLSEVDLFALENTYQEIRLKRYRAETRQRATRSLLAQTLNKPDDLPSDLEVPLLPENKRELPEYEALVEQAMIQNPKLMALNSEMNASRYRMAASRAQNYPTLTGEVRASYYNREFGSRNPFTAGVILDIPIYTGDRTDGDTAVAQAGFMRLQAEHRNEEFIIRQQLLDTWQEIQTLMAQREQATTQIDFRELYLDRSRALYELEATADLGDAMVEQTRARLLELRTELELALSWATIDVLLGNSPRTERAPAAQETSR